MHKKPNTECDQNQKVYQNLAKRSLIVHCTKSTDSCASHYHILHTCNIKITTEIIKDDIIPY